MRHLTQSLTPDARLPRDRSDATERRVKTTGAEDRFAPDRHVYPGRVITR